MILLICVTNSTCLQNVHKHGSELQVCSFIYQVFIDHSLCKESRICTFTANYIFIYGTFKNGTPGPVPFHGPGPPSLPLFTSAPPPLRTVCVLFGHQEPYLRVGVMLGVCVLCCHVFNFEVLFWSFSPKVFVVSLRVMFSLVHYLFQLHFYIFYCSRKSL